ncbi:MAG: hypothetical protein U1E59_11860 [Amaricoccus sp.]
MNDKRSLVELIADGMFARAAATLVGECAAELPMLVYNERLPDTQFQTIRDWSEQLLSTEPWAGFDLEGLPGLFHALNIALLSCYAYAPQEDRANPPRPGRVHLRFTDTGGALLVERARAAAGVIAVAIHGPEGETVLYAADAELHALIDAISAAVARAQ